MTADMEQRSPEVAIALPLIIIVGGDALALKACSELTSARGQVVTVLWADGSDGFGDKVRELGAGFVERKPNDEDALRAAGVLRAASIMTLTDDDHLNLLVALKARDLNPAIRIVLSQFNRTLGRKLEQNLSDCSVSRSRRTRPRPTPGRPSIITVSTACNSPTSTGRWSDSSAVRRRRAESPEIRSLLRRLRSPSASSRSMAKRVTIAICRSARNTN